MKFQFDHNNITVLDIEKSIKFYEEALGLKEIKRKIGKGYTIVYLSDGVTNHKLELTQFHDRKEPYNLGDNELHLCLKVDDVNKAYELHKKMGCICYENKEMNLYFIADPDGFWIEILDINRK